MNSVATHAQLIGSVLKRNRIRVGHSQKEVVEELNAMYPWLKMSYSSYSRFESGDAAMSIFQFEAFCRWLENHTESRPVADEIFYEFRKLADQVEDKGVKVVAGSESKEVKVVDTKTLTGIVRDIFPAIGDSPIKQTLAASALLLAGGLPALLLKKTFVKAVSDNNAQDEGGDDEKK